VPNCFQITTEPCPVCLDLTEAVAVIEETVQALEEGTWTMATIARARKFLGRARHQYSL
jgi:hypothetical protein